MIKTSQSEIGTWQLSTLTVVSLKTQGGPAALCPPQPVEKSGKAVLIWVYWIVLHGEWGDPFVWQIVVPFSFLQPQSAAALVCQPRTLFSLSSLQKDQQFRYLREITKTDSGLPTWKTTCGEQLSFLRQLQAAGWKFWLWGPYNPRRYHRAGETVVEYHTFQNLGAKCQEFPRTGCSLCATLWVYHYGLLCPALLWQCVLYPGDRCTERQHPCK